MVGGLVMGALEKLYHQPSLFTYALLASVCSLYLSSLKRPKKGAVSVPPTLPWVQSDCTFSIQPLQAIYRHTPSFQVHCPPPCMR